MKTLIIDPSSTVCGWSIMADARIMAYGDIDVSKSEYADRFPHIVEALRVVYQHYPDISQIVMEKPVLISYRDKHGKSQRRDNSALRVACRAIKGWAKTIKTPVFEVHPSTWKSQLIGYANCDKDMVRQYIESRYPKLPKGVSEHVIDAIAMGCYYHKLRQLEG